jgi:hypothetical protein
MIGSSNIFLSSLYMMAKYLNSKYLKLFWTYRYLKKIENNFLLLFTSQSVHETVMKIFALDRAFGGKVCEFEVFQKK